MLCWSNSMQRFFIFCSKTGQSYFETEACTIASFYDHLPALCKDNKLCRKDLCWMWSWQAEPKSGYGPEAILQQNEFDGKLTTKSLCARIRERQNEYPPNVMTHQIL